LVFWSVDRPSLQKITMGKIIYQFLVLVVLFFLSWFTISRFDFIQDDEIAKFGKQNIRKLGDLMIKSLDDNHTQIKSGDLKMILDSIKVKICKAHGVSPDTIQLHLFKSSEVNAFALPGNHIIVFSGLIAYAENAEEIAGVLSHELGHVTKNHIERKLVKEVGLSMLFVLVGGNEGQQILQQVLHTLSSTAFDREFETEADMFAVETMTKANIDPEHLSNFMFRIAQDNKIPDELIWLSSHPDSKDRAAEILKEKKKYSFKPEPVVNTSWKTIEERVDDL